MNKRSFLAGMLLTLFLLGFSASSSAEEFLVKVTFTNPSELDAKEEDSKYYLPYEVKFKDILDAGGLELTYDESRSCYYLHKKLLLQPKEEKTFKILVNNVWLIEPEELRFLKKQTEERITNLEGTPNYEQAKTLAEQIVKELARIETEQVTAGGDMAKKIEAFRVNTERIRNIRNTVLLLDDYKQYIDEDIEMKKVPKNIGLKFKVKNKSQSDPRKEIVKQYLAEGIQAEYITDLQGFEVHFDPEKRLYYLTKEVELAPGEERVFNLMMEDRWVVRNEKLDGFTKEADDVMIELEETEFADRARFLVTEIGKIIGTIKDLQARKVSIRDKMAFFKDNLKRVEVIRKNILELRRMLEIIRERERQKKLEEILRRVFKEAAWKIIYGTIMLLGLISVMTYILWWGQTKQKQGEKYEEIQ